jgi:hypothetical protein
MFFGKLWLRIKGELLVARDNISADADTLRKPDELLKEAKNSLKAFLTDSTIQDRSRTEAPDPATQQDPEVTGEPKTGRNGQTSEPEPCASNPRKLG